MVFTHHCSLHFVHQQHDSFPTFRSLYQHWCHQSNSFPLSVSGSNWAWRPTSYCSSRPNTTQETHVLTSVRLLLLTVSVKEIVRHVNFISELKNMEDSCSKLIKCPWNFASAVPLSLSPHHNPWQVQHRKLQASKVLSNYQCSLFPCEMRSVWDDNMGIHYSLELEASCRSMVRTYQKPNTGYFCTHQAWRLSTTSSWEAASGRPCLLTSLS